MKVVLGKGSRPGNLLQGRVLFQMFLDKVHGLADAPSIFLKGLLGVFRCIHGLVHLLVFKRSIARKKETPHENSILPIPGGFGTKSRALSKHGNSFPRQFQRRVLKIFLALPRGFSYIDNRKIYR
jgi:hypothetical protein